MTLDRRTILALADRVDRAQTNAEAITRLTDEHPGMSIADGYAVQDELRWRRKARGHRIVGFKAGLTSPAKMKQMGVDTPSFGFLSSDMAVPEGSLVRVAELVHPRVEPEVAFLTCASLRGPGCDAEAVLAATAFVVPAIEIIDSRYEAFRFDLPSVIADDGSAARFVVGGRPRRAAELDLEALGVVLEKNGEIVALGAASAVLGHPARAVAALANHVAERGEELPEGSLVLTGGITEAIAVKAGDHVLLRAQDLGSVSVRFG